MQLFQCTKCKQWRRLDPFSKVTNKKKVNCSSHGIAPGNSCDAPPSVTEDQVSLFLIESNLRQQSDAMQSVNAGVDEKALRGALQPFLRQGEQLPPPFKYLAKNKYLSKAVSRTRDEGEYLCDCDPDEDECGEGCMTRMMNYECWRGACPVGDNCSNQAIQRRQYPPVYIKETPGKGWGMFCDVDLPGNTFVVEYCGEVMSKQAFTVRAAKYDQAKANHFYFMSLDNRYMIDGANGNIARFINHSCGANCETQKWEVKGLNRVAIYTTEDVPAGVELTFNYNFDVYGDNAQKCRCGHPKCKGIIGNRKKARTSRNSGSGASTGETGSPMERKEGGEVEGEGEGEPRSLEDGEVEEDPLDGHKVAAAIAATSALLEPTSTQQEELGRLSELGEALVDACGGDPGSVEDPNSLVDDREAIVKLAKIMGRAQFPSIPVLKVLAVSKGSPSLKTFLEFHGARFLQRWMDSAVKILQAAFKRKDNEVNLTGRVDHSVEDARSTVDLIFSVLDALPLTVADVRASRLHLECWRISGEDQRADWVRSLRSVRKTADGAPLLQNASTSADHGTADMKKVVGEATIEAAIHFLEQWRGKLRAGDSRIALKRKSGWGASLGSSGSKRKSGWGASLGSSGSLPPFKHTSSPIRHTSSPIRPASSMAMSAGSSSMAGAPPEPRRQIGSGFQQPPPVTGAGRSSYPGSSLPPSAVGMHTPQRPRGSLPPQGSFNTPHYGNSTPQTMGHPAGTSTPNYGYRGAPQGGGGFQEHPSTPSYNSHGSLMGGSGGPGGYCGPTGTGSPAPPLGPGGPPGRFSSAPGFSGSQGAPPPPSSYGTYGINGPSSGPNNYGGVSDYGVGPSAGPLGGSRWGGAPPPPIHYQQRPPADNRYLGQQRQQSEEATRAQKFSVNDYQAAAEAEKRKERERNRKIAEAARERERAAVRERELREEREAARAAREEEEEALREEQEHVRKYGERVTSEELKHKVASEVVRLLDGIKSDIVDIPSFEFLARHMTHFVVDAERKSKGSTRLMWGPKVRSGINKYVVQYFERRRREGRLPYAKPQ